MYSFHHLQTPSCIFLVQTLERMYNYVYHVVNLHDIIEGFPILTYCFILLASVYMRCWIFQLTEIKATSWINTYRGKLTDNMDATDLQIHLHMAYIFVSCWRWKYIVNYWRDIIKYFLQ